MRSRDDIICFSSGGPITWGRFAADVEALRPRITAASHVCNVLGDRYDFLVGLAATILEDRITVLPNSAAPEAVAGALREADAPLILGGKPDHDRLGHRIDPIGYGTDETDPTALVAALEASETEIHVFTSGSTSRPTRHLKTWSILKGGAFLTAHIVARLGRDLSRVALLGTTPHQHMYGLEAMAFAGLGFGYASYRHPLFFPTDIESAIEAARAVGIDAVVLVTSPAHLKFLEPTILANPQICGVISATAPLSLAQAQRLEARGEFPVMEIYGSTETGSLAIRRTVEGPLWQPIAGFELTPTADGCLASAPHLPEAVPLGDSVELHDDGRFNLLGRVGDMISINGKKTTLAALNALLIETPGLGDGVVVHRRHGDDTSLAIVAVRDPASQLDEAQTRAAIRRHLLGYLDPVFVPRRIVFTDRLPRSGTGKIPSSDLDALAALARH